MKEIKIAVYDAERDLEHNSYFTDKREALEYERAIVSLFEMRLPLSAHSKVRRFVDGKLTFSTYLY